MADTYDIVEQRQTGAFGAAGRPIQVVRVTFRTKPSGDIGEVDIPVAEYDHDAVDAKIRPYAAEMERARGL